MGFWLQSLMDWNAERRRVIKTIRPYTHVNYQRLKFLWNTTETIGKSGMEGSLVETGVWRGGCAGIMAYMSKQYGYRNRLCFYDSFEGLPEPTDLDGEDALIFASGQSTGRLVSIGKVKAEESYIKELLFDKLKISPDKVEIIKGWFQDTLPRTKKRVGPIALLRLDGDWYDSTKVVLKQLYDQVVPGGYVLVDDYYFWDGCRRAVDDYIAEHNLKIRISRQDMSGVWWVKD